VIFSLPWIAQRHGRWRSSRLRPAAGRHRAALLHQRTEG